jgi:hypothetical protein
MSFYATMDRPLASFVFLGFSAVFAIAGCGDASTPRIDGPGAHQSGVAGDGGSGTTGNAPDASPYKDPKAQDGGCSAPNEVCSGVCTAVDTDPANCGGCGSACIGSDAVCNGGKCGCSGQLEDYCDGVGCMDVSSDFANCGMCGYACDPNNDQACAGGVCIPNDP